MINSQQLWADTVSYDPDTVEYLVVSDSTLVWTKRNRGPHLKTWRQKATFTVLGGAKAQDYVNLLVEHEKKDRAVWLKLESVVGKRVATCPCALASVHTAAYLRSDHLVLA